MAGKRFIGLADSTLRELELAKGGRWAVGRDARAYVSDWKESQADYYRVDTQTGAREPIVTGQGRTLGLSPDGRYFAYWRQGHIWVYDLDKELNTNLTASAPVSFVNQQWDRPGTKPSYGLAGWSADRRSVILNHRYDL